MTSLFIFFIRLYQYTIAPMLGNCCKFSPTCSYYAIDALQKYGLLKGGWLACRRIIRCNPWHKGSGEDLP